MKIDIIRMYRDDSNRVRIELIINNDKVKQGIGFLTLGIEFFDSKEKVICVKKHVCTRVSYGKNIEEIKFYDIPDNAVKVNIFVQDAM